MSEVKEIDVVCSSCDGFCPVTAKVVDGQVVKVGSRKDPMLKDIICKKGAYAPKAFAHPDRLTQPLRRVGPRGSGQWETVSWDEAMDDITDKLKDVVAQYGPEAVAVATSNWNTTVDNGMCRRFMNLLGSPNFVSGVAYCMGNTAAVNRMVYGWYPRADIINSKCIVLFGHNPRRHSWTAEYKMIRVAQAMGAKLIVLDPRKSENAEEADLWLPVRAGTDAALTIGWLKVIIEEELYDKDFVDRWTVGWDELVARFDEYSMQKIVEITGVDEALIRESARMYATAEASCIPWSPITDQQTSSTSAIRLQCILRALTSNLDIKGGDRFYDFNPGIISDTDLELHDQLSGEQKAKQLGSKEHPVFTYAGMEPLREATKKVWDREWANLIGGCYMANPTSVFRAMAEEDPYPVKALLSLGNNTLMAFANTKQIYKGMMNQDLIVVHEHMMTPTAQIADYVLPGDAWLERASMMGGVNPQAMQPPGECKSVFYLWTQLARRMGMAEHFPWDSLEELYDHRLSPSGTTWAEAQASGALPAMSSAERKYEQTGFATPSGKVELYSSVLEDLGFDPLPYYREAAEPTEEYPLRCFVGVRDDEYFQTGQRFVPELRKRAPEPTLFINPADAEPLNIGHGDWCYIETSMGRIVHRADVREQIPAGLVRIPHGWWKPESKAGGESLSGMWTFSDAQLNDDSDMSLMDVEQGIPHLKGIPCRVTRMSDEEVEALEAEYGESSALPPGPEARIERAEPEDFMYDAELGSGVEFQAVELAIYGKGTVN